MRKFKIYLDNEPSNYTEWRKNNLLTADSVSELSHMAKEWCDGEND